MSFTVMTRKARAVPVPASSCALELAVMTAVAGGATLAAAGAVVFALGTPAPQDVSGSAGGRALCRLEVTPETVVAPATSAAPAARGWFDEILPGRLRRGATAPLYSWPAAKGVEIELVYVPAGEFVMGADDAIAFPEEAPRHAHAMRHGYWIGRTPVTWKQYDAFCAATGAELAGRPTWATDRHAAVNVDWSDARSFCRWAGLALPTEAEWEKAAASPVGALDMTGCVWQWCEDRWTRGPCAEEAATGDATRVYSLRGGSWRDPAVLRRPTNRRSVGASLTADSVGFRVVLRAE